LLRKNLPIAFRDFSVVDLKYTLSYKYHYLGKSRYIYERGVEFTTGSKSGDVGIWLQYGLGSSAFFPFRLRLAKK